MVVYKLKHKPTGLYFTPSRGHGNLSKTGKIYSNKPSLEWVKQVRVVLYSWKAWNMMQAVQNDNAVEFFKNEKASRKLLKLLHLNPDGLIFKFKNKLYKTKKINNGLNGN